MSITPIQPHKADPGAARTSPGAWQIPKNEYRLRPAVDRGNPGEPRSSSPATSSPPSPRRPGGRTNQAPGNQFRPGVLILAEPPHTHTPARALEPGACRGQARHGGPAGLPRPPPRGRRPGGPPGAAVARPGAPCRSWRCASPPSRRCAAPLTCKRPPRARPAPAAPMPGVRLRWRVEREAEGGMGP